MIGNDYSEIIGFADFTILMRDGTNIKYLTRENIRMNRNFGDV